MSSGESSPVTGVGVIVGVGVRVRVMVAVGRGVGEGVAKPGLHPVISRRKIKVRRR